MEICMPRSRIKPRKGSRLRNRDVGKVADAATVAVNVPLLEEMDSLVRERLDLHAQLFEAAQIQRKLSGPRSVRCGHMEFASEVFAVRYLPGDFAVLSQNGSKVLATLGDIAGKGFAAGMWFTNLAGLLQSYGHPDSDPAQTVKEINRHLCYLRPAAPFVTAFLAQIDCGSGQVAYCNAGHFAPILLCASGQAELLEVGGPLLGAVESAEYESGHVSLEPGDTLLAYSDGVLECPNEAGEEFGSGRLLAALQQTKQLSARKALVALLAAVQDFANGNPLSDDVSLTVIRRD
jgi:sigma-B regulation protein RsbU (phosphoserine phosphatase)